MMRTTDMLSARAGAAAIAAALALSPTYAAAPKPIIDLSQSPAATGKAAPKSAPAAKAGIAGIDERTLELGGGAAALIILGAGAFAVARSRRRRREEAAWAEETTGEEARDPLFDEPMFHHEQPAAEASAMAQEQPCDQPSDDGSDRCPGESWVERAHRGPSPANPSASLRHRLSRAAFFDKRERDVAAGKAEPVDPDAGLPEAMVEEQERELA
jgi:hypothetical protein